jgi:signal transduction histidine kinase
MPADAQPISHSRRWLLAVGAGVLGFGLNFLPFTIMPSVQFIFGPIPALVAALTLGPWYGLVAGAIAGAATVPAWGHGIAMAVFALEGLAIGYGARRLSPMASSIVFWLLVGGPLVGLGYTQWLHLPGPVVGPLVLKQVLNGWLNVMAAMVIVALAPAWLPLAPGQRRVRRRQPLQRVLLLVMAMLAVVPIIFAGGAYGHFRWDQELERLTQGQQIRAEAVAGYIHRYIDTRVHIVETAAKLLAERPLAPELKLRIFQESIPGFLSIYLADANGRVLAIYPPAQSGGKTMVGQSVADRPYFKALKAGAHTYVSELLVARVDNHLPSITVSARIEHDGKFVGYVTGALDLIYFHELMDRWLVGTSAGGLVDREGRYIVPPAGARALDRSTLPFKADQPAGAFEFPLGDARPPVLAAQELQRRVGYHAPVPGLGWQLWVEDPVTLVQSRTQESFMAVMGWMALGVLMAFLVSLWLSRYLAEPLLKLARESQAFARGDLNALDSHGPMPVEELETLAVNLEEMAAQVRHKEANLETLVRERTAELTLANGRLEGALTELKHLDRAKADFLNVISHELRTPLNFIMGFSSFLEDEGAGALNGQQHHYLQRILEGSERLLELVNNLLDYARMEAGNFRVEPSAIGLESLMSAISADLQPLADKKVLVLDWQAAPQLPMVLADRARIEQVLLNLVGNAIKFTPEGGRVSMSATHAPGGMVRVSVTDTGIGIAPEALPKLFTKFYQVDGTTTREYGGTGLGLAIVKSLIEAHGGHVTVESRPGEGSVFSFTLPAIPAPPGARREGPRSATA